MTEQTQQSNGTQALYSIDFDDVRRASTVRQAIIDRCPEEYEIADPRQLDGQAFQTSGPGSGWTREFGAADYARAAIERWVAESGANASEARAIDPDDGRAAHGTDDYDDDGRWIGDLVWSEGSVIDLECPRTDDAIFDPERAANMAEAALDDHAACSDVDDWRKLVGWLKRVGEEFDRKAFRDIPAT